MKKLITAAFLFATAYVVAIPEQETFLQAMQLYNNNDVEQSKDLLASIEPKNFSVHYNLGNCYYHLKKYPEAIYNWNKAQKSASFKDYLALEENIDNASRQFGILEERSAWKSCKVYFLAGTNGFSTVYIQLLILLIWLMLMAAILNRYKKSSGMLFVATLTLLLAYFAKQRPERAALLDQASLLAGPDDDYHQLKNLKAGNRVQLLAKKGNWYKVKYHDLHGWLPSHILD